MKIAIIVLLSCCIVGVLGDEVIEAVDPPSLILPDCEPDCHDFHKECPANDTYDCTDPEWKLRCPKTCEKCIPCDFAHHEHMVDVHEVVNDLRNETSSNLKNLEEEIKELEAKLWAAAEENNAIVHSALESIQRSINVTCVDRESCNSRGECGNNKVCKCERGWTGDLCEYDDNECADDNACIGGVDLVECMNTFGSYECVCKDLTIRVSDNECKPQPVILTAERRANLNRVLPSGKKVATEMCFKYDPDDNIDTTKFHIGCDNKGSTVVVMEVPTTGWIIGAYVEEPWSSSNTYVQTDSFQSFMFRIVGDEFDTRPFRADKIVSQVSYGGYGPILGNCDLIVHSNGDVVVQQQTSNSFEFYSIDVYWTGNANPSFVVKEFEVWLVTDTEE